MTEEVTFPMRKFFAVALLAVFVVGVTGLVTVASSVVTKDVPDENLESFVDSLNQNDGLDLTVSDIESFEKVKIVSPEGIEDGEYVAKNLNSNGKVLVIVDPIHVTE